MTPRLDAMSALAAIGAPWLLVLARSLGACWSAPAVSSPGLGWRPRLVLAALLSALLTPLVAADLPTPSTWPALAWACLAEAAVGAGLGWAGSLVVAGARQAGEVVGAQSGLAPAALFDPEAGDGMTPLGHLYGMLALAVFLALDGPIELVRALAESFRAVPAGLAVDPATAVDRASAGLMHALELTLRASAPPALALTVAGLALGLLGRAAPSLQLVALSLPARALLGLALAGLGLASLAATLAGAWGSSFPFAPTGF